MILWLILSTTIFKTFFNFIWEKYLRAERFHAIPNTTDADKTWLHWKCTFTSFLQSVSTTTADVNKLDMLVNYVSPSVYEYISECTTYDSAIKFLESLFIVPKNEIISNNSFLHRSKTFVLLQYFCLSVLSVHQSLSGKVYLPKKLPDNCVHDT